MHYYLEAWLVWTQYDITQKIFFFLMEREHIGSVVECLTQDWEAVG